VKIVINKCFGGFDLSHKAIMLYAKKKGMGIYAYETDYSDRLTPNDFSVKYIKVEDNESYRYCLDYLTKDFGDSFIDLDDSGKEINDYYFSKYDIERTDPALVEVVEELKEEASANGSELIVGEVPDDVPYEIHDHDGWEEVTAPKIVYC
jgi:hypothetical protein